MFINATGKIKWFKIEFSIFFLLCLPVGYILFSMGYPAYSMVILFIIADALQRIVQLFLLKVLLGFDSLRFVREAYTRPFVIAVMMGTMLYVYSFLSVDCIWMRFTAISLCAVITSMTVLFVGLMKSEREKVLGKIKIALRI